MNDREEQLKGKHVRIALPVRSRGCVVLTQRGVVGGANAISVGKPPKLVYYISQCRVHVD